MRLLGREWRRMIDIKRINIIVFIKLAVYVRKQPHPKKVIG